MNKPVVEVQIRAVMPTKDGCAVFLGNKEKVFIIFVDQGMGAVITMFMRETPKERPLTHDLMANLLLAFGAKVERVIVNAIVESTYYARVILSVENEVTPQRKLVELDSRPSDALALALRLDCPIYVEETVLKSSKLASTVSDKVNNEELRRWLEGLNDEDLGRYKM